MNLLKATFRSQLALPVAAVFALQVVVTQLQSDLGLSPMSSARAQEEGQKPQRETRRTPALRNKVFERLSEAQAALEAKDLGTGERILDEMIAASRKDTKLNSYELANVWNLKAFIAYSREDYSGALKAYQTVVSQPDIPLAMEINTRFTIAQLYFVQEKWQEGIDALLVWFNMTETPNANAYVLLAQGYYQVKDYNKALVNVEKAISMNKEAGKVPKEQWYNLARFLYFEKNDIPNTVRTLEALLTHYPKKEYWVQVSHLYGEQKKEADQLAAMDTAYVQNMLDKGTEQVTMAYLYLNADAPYYAAKVLDKGLDNESIEATSKNWELTGNAWRQAQELEKSIPAMEKAASKSDKGELYSRLCNIYLDNDEYKRAISTCNKALSRGGVKRPDTTRLVLGMAYFNDKQYDSAKEAFQAASKDERSEKYAEQWLSYMESELARQEALRAEDAALDAALEAAAEPEQQDEEPSADGEAAQETEAAEAAAAADQPNPQG